MAKPQMVKCRNCKTLIEKDKAYAPKNTKGRYYCNEDCYSNRNKPTNKVSCCHCDKKIVKEEDDEYNGTGIRFIEDLNRYVCKKCYDEFITTDRYFKFVFLDYVYREIAGGNTDFRILEQQAETLKVKYDMKWQGMKLTCEYWKNILENTWNEQWYLGQIFPKYYDEAKKNYLECEEIKKAVEEFEFDDTVLIIKKSNNSRINKEVRF